jgi:hypothetical protein
MNVCHINLWSNFNDMLKHIGITVIILMIYINSTKGINVFN